MLTPGQGRLSYQRAWSLFREASGGQWTLHQLRHSALTHLGEDGVLAPLLMAKSRHRDLSKPDLTPLEKELAARQEALNQELKAKKKELQDAQRLRKETLKRQIRRAQSRVSAAERKRRTRRLILMGSYMEHVTGNDPEKRDSPHEGT